MTGRNTALSGTGILAAERALGTALGGLVGIVIARHLGPSTFGQYAVILAIVGLAIPFTDLGRGFIVTDMVRGDSHPRSILATAMRATGVLSCAATVVVLMIAATRDAHNLALAVAGLSLIWRPTAVIDYYFQAKRSFRSPALLRIAVSTGFNVGRLLLVATDAANVLWLGVLLAVEASALAVGYVFLLRRQRGEEPRSHRAWSGVPRFLRRNSPLMLASVAVAIYMRIDVVMLGSLADDTEAGRYAAAVRISELAYVLPVVLMTVLTPQLAALAKDEERFRQRFDEVCSAFAAASFVVVFAVLIAADLLVSVLFGPSYSDSAIVLRVHILAAPFVFLGVAQGVWTAVYELQRLLMWRAVFGAGLNVCLNALLIPGYGATGAAIATALAYAATISANAVSAQTRPVAIVHLSQLSPRHLVHNLSNTARSMRITTSRGDDGRTNYP